MKKQQKLPRQILALAILTSFTVFTWITLDIYRTLRQPTSPKVPPSQLASLDPKLETAILNNLSQREILSQEEFVVPVATESGTKTQ